MSPPATRQDALQYGVAFFTAYSSCARNLPHAVRELVEPERMKHQSEQFSKNFTHTLRGMGEPPYSEGVDYASAREGLRNINRGVSLGPPAIDDRIRRLATESLPLPGDWEERVLSSIGKIVYDPMETYLPEEVLPQAIRSIIDQVILPATGRSARTP